MKVYEILDKINDIETIVGDIRQYNDDDVDMEVVADILSEYRTSLLAMDVKEASE